MSARKPPPNVGMAKFLYSKKQKDPIIHPIKDQAAHHPFKNATIISKNMIYNRLSADKFSPPRPLGIADYVIKKNSARKLQIDALDNLPLTVIIRNLSANSIYQRRDLNISLLNA